MTQEQWAHVMDVNLKVVSFTAQEMQRHLSTRGGLEQWFPGGQHRVVRVLSTDRGKN
jgi:NAD(P)-dependent dehydrogenase (short-subunit alcohol dehydrogenase family)